MGSVVNDFSTLSWPGKVHDDPKPYDIAARGRDSISREELADFEANMLKLINEIAEKVAKDSLEGKDYRQEK